MDSTILSVIIGSFLGFMATLLSIQLTTYLDERTKKRSHAQYLKLEFEGSIKALDEIRTGFEHQHFFDYLLIDILDSYVSNLLDARKQTYLIKNEKLQADVFSAINRISILSKDMRGIQNHEWSENTTTDATTGQKRVLTAVELTAKKGLIDDKRQSHLMEILDLKREVKSLLEKLNAVNK